MNTAGNVVNAQGKPQPAEQPDTQYQPGYRQGLQHDPEEDDKGEPIQRHAVDVGGIVDYLAFIRLYAEQAQPGI